MSCDKKTTPPKVVPQKVQPNQDKTVSVNFAGYDLGCKDYYNPIFCADEYKAKTSLQAGSAPKKYEIYIKDENNKTIVLSPKQTDILLNLKFKDK